MTVERLKITRVIDAVL